MPDDGRKVQFISGRGFFGIHCSGRFGRGHRKSKLVRCGQNQSEILMHEAKWKLWRVVVVPGCRELSRMRRSDHSGPGQHVKEEVARQVKPLAQRNGLSDCL